MTTSPRPSRPRWLPPPSEVERWDQEDRRHHEWQELGRAKAAWKRLARCLLEMIDDDPASIRADLPAEPELLERFDTLVRAAYPEWRGA